MKQLDIHITRDSLRTASEELSQLHVDMLTVPSIDLGRGAMALESVRELKDTFSQQLSRYCERLEDGRLLLKPLYRALARFCLNNDTPLEGVLRKATIEGGVVVACHFDYCGLTTLEGLEDVWSLRELCVFANENLSSLRGIPTQNLEWIDASNCGLVGDLSAIATARRLRFVDVDSNPWLTSLAGIPPWKIQEVYAAHCGLTGEHSFLAGAPHLRMLCLEENPKTLSLNRAIFSQQVMIQL
jgi:hypothetical protein